MSARRKEEEKKQKEDKKGPQHIHQQGGQKFIKNKLDKKATAPFLLKKKNYKVVAMNNQANT